MGSDQKHFSTTQSTHSDISGYLSCWRPFSSKLSGIKRFSGNCFMDGTPRQSLPINNDALHFKLIWLVLENDRLEYGAKIVHPTKLVLFLPESVFRHNSRGRTRLPSRLCRPGCQGQSSWRPLPRKTDQEKGGKGLWATILMPLQQFSRNSTTG